MEYLRSRPSSRVKSFSYEPLGRVTQVTFPSTLSESYTFDAVGNLLTKTDRKGQTITYAYDNLYRLATKNYPDSTSVAYTYDALSRLTQATDPTGTYGFAFDNLGRLTQASTQYSFLSGQTLATSYSYDAASNRVSLTNPQGGATNYVYDSLNRETSLTDFASRTFTFGYDALGRRTNLTRPNGVNTSYAYDNLSRLLSVSHLAGSSTLDGATYNYDAAGNRTAKTVLPGNVTSAFNYDSIYQLLQVTQGTQTKESYTYDAVGNRTYQPGAPYNYNSSNEMTSREGVPCTYDANGNTTGKTNGSGTTGYNWDFENRLTSVTLPGTGGTVSFKYDPFGRRIEKTSPSGSTIYVYDGDNIIEELTASGGLGERYTYGQGLDEPLVGQRNPKIFYYEADGLGSVTSLTDPTGAVAATYTYDSFGFMTASTGSATNWFRYTARQFDSETALYYYRERYYDPTVGRFLSEDRIGFSAGIDFYTYVGNRPLNFRDPSGQQSLPALPSIPGWEVITGGAAATAGEGVGATFGAAVETGSIGGPIGIFAAVDAGLIVYDLNQGYQLAQSYGYFVPQPSPSGPYDSPALNYHSNQAKKKCANNGCKPCIPPVGTISYRLDTTGRPHAGVPPPHWQLYVMQQNPENCQCQWKELTGSPGFGAGTPPAGTVEIGPAGGGGRP